MIGAVASHQFATRLPSLNRDPQVDAAIKAALGLGLVFAAAWVKEPMLKTAVIALGVGVGSAAAVQLIPALQG